MRRQSSNIAYAVAAILFLLATLPYLQTLRDDFVYDDQLYVVSNPYVQQGLTRTSVGWALTTSHGGNWHPVTWLSHMLDVTVWGTQPAGHHFTNVVLHAANTLLLFLIFLQMTGATWRSGLVAALFAVHPLHVESVAWVSERKDVLSAFFGLLALLAWLKYARAPSVRQYLLLLCLFALSLMSKQMLVSLPCILLLLDIWPLGRWKLWRVNESAIPLELSGNPKPVARLFLEKVPLISLSAIFCVVAFIAQHAGKNTISTELIPLSARVGNAIVGYRFYLDKLFLPVKLAVFYPFPGYWRPAVILTSAFLLLVITLVAIFCRRRFPWLLVGWLWFIVTLIPVIGLVQIGMQSAADRYTYIPSIGIFMMLVWSIPAAHNLLVRRAWIFAACAAVILLAMKTQIQASYWQNRRTLFTHAASVTEGNYIAHQSLGVERETNDHDLEGALQFYRMAADEQPKLKWSGIHENIANILVQQGRSTEALGEIKKALEIDPSSASALNGLGEVLIASGQNEEALKCFQRAAEIDPEFLEARINCGQTLAKLDRWNEAVERLAPAAKLAPRRYLARTYLAQALYSRGDVDQAIDQLNQVLKLKPDNATALDLLQQIEAEQKQQSRHE